MTCTATNAASGAVADSSFVHRAAGGTHAPSVSLRGVGQVRAELRRLLGPLLSHVRARSWRAVPATIVLLLIMLLFTFGPTGGVIGSLTRSVSAVSADLPWWQAALRLPASMFAPASNLPAWGALAQVAVIGVVAESSLGWRRMLAIGSVANAVATGGARAMAWLGPHFPLGISAHAASLPDTGPSVFVTAVLIYLALVYRTPIVLSLTTVTMIGEAAITPNLAGREHLIGMASAAMLAATARVVRPDQSPCQQLLRGLPDPYRADRSGTPKPITL